MLLFIHFPGSGSSDYTPDRPIGYGAFGVVWSVTDPRDGKRVALKKLPNVFQSLVSSKRVFRELKMMRFFKHDNVLSCLDILQVYLSRSLPYMKLKETYRNENIPANSEIRVSNIFFFLSLLAPSHRLLSRDLYDH